MLRGRKNRLPVRDALAEQHGVPLAGVRRPILTVQRPNPSRIRLDPRHRISPRLETRPHIQLQHHGRLRILRQHFDRPNAIDRHKLRLVIVIPRMHLRRRQLLVRFVQHIGKLPPPVDPLPLHIRRSHHHVLAAQESRSGRASSRYFPSSHSTTHCASSSISRPDRRAAFACPSSAARSSPSTARRIRRTGNPSPRRPSPCRRDLSSIPRAPNTTRARRESPTLAPVNPRRASQTAQSPTSPKTIAARKPLVSRAEAFAKCTHSVCFVIAACYAESISISRVPSNAKKSSRQRRKKIPYSSYTNSTHRVSKSPYGSQPRALCSYARRRICMHKFQKTHKHIASLLLTGSPDRSARCRSRRWLRRRRPRPKTIAITMTASGTTTSKPRGAVSSPKNTAKITNTQNPRKKSKRNTGPGATTTQIDTRRSADSHNRFANSQKQNGWPKNSASRFSVLNDLQSFRNADVSRKNNGSAS